MSGEYKLECWGGGLENDMTHCGGYSVGTTSLIYPTKLYVCVGGQGNAFNGRFGGKGGYNGGGDGGNGSPIKNDGSSHNYTGGWGGGGATHIAKNTGLLTTFSSDYKTNLYLVAGGSGGTETNLAIVNNNGSVAIPYGGGLEGGAPCSSYCAGSASYKEYAKATQTSGWAFGQGQNGISKNIYGGSNGAEGNGGGGGGLYGGFSPQIRGAGGTNAKGGGGSGFVNSSLLTNAQTIAGNLSFPSVDGGTETGHAGNGACVVTQTSF